MFYKLKLSNFKNLHFILTTKYLILINKKGFLKFQTNFYKYYLKQTNKLLYIKSLNFNLSSKKSLNYIKYFYLISKLTTKLNSYNYFKIYLKSLYLNLYKLQYPFQLTLTLKGVGYKFILEKSTILKLRLGYSHYITYNVNPSIKIKLIKPAQAIFYSTNKQLLMHIVSTLKKKRKINVYKGTGIFYSDETLKIKKRKINKTKNAK